MSTITVTGNVCADPELRFVTSGTPTCTFRIAENRKRGDSDESETHFFDVTCWRELAENVAQSCRKGTRVVVTGRLDEERWETKEGEKRSRVKITAFEIGPSLRWASAQVEKNERSGS